MADCRQNLPPFGGNRVHIGVNIGGGALHDRNSSWQGSPRVVDRSSRINAAPAMNRSLERVAAPIEMHQFARGLRPLTVKSVKAAK